MNTLLLVLGLLAWSGPASIARLTAVFAAIGVFSIEMQAVTWLGAGSLRSLAIVNLVIAIGLIATRRRARALPVPVPPRVVPWSRAVPWPALLVLAALVAALNISRPLEAADPYHLEKVDRIEHTGTLAYDPAADPKVNIVSSLYELVLADVRAIPVAGPTLVRLHGLFGLALYLLGIGAVREWLDAGDSWYWALMLTVPVVFHQLVLVKNDLFVGVPALVVLVWALARARSASSVEIGWASWLAALVVAVKVTMAPVWIVMAVAILVRQRDRGRALVAIACGSVAGVVSGGLLFAVVENVRMYGSLMPTAGIGDRNTTVAAVAISIGRFAISLVDLGLVTRTVWPGRGGWGGTFGLPLIWALLVLAWRSRESTEARTALLLAGACLLPFAAAFPDADVAQRLVLGPGLLLVAVAIHLAPAGRGFRVPAQATAAAVALLSAAQIARSAILYFNR